MACRQCGYFECDCDRERRLDDLEDEVNSLVGTVDNTVSDGRRLIQIRVVQPFDFSNPLLGHREMEVIALDECGQMWIYNRKSGWEHQPLPRLARTHGSPDDA